MASSNEIPNLKTLLGTRRGGGLRGRGRGGGGIGTSSEGNEQVRDNAVKGTDQDAAGSRVSCVELGYLHDPYAKLFATQPATRRLPLLNRGNGSTISHVCNQLLNSGRNICSHLSNRPASHQVPHYLSFLCETDRLTRCWHGYTLLSPYGLLP
jgi:hypothetical protein